MKKLFLTAVSALIFAACSSDADKSSINENKFNYTKLETNYDITLFDEKVNEMGVIKAEISQRIYFGKTDSSLSTKEIKLYLNERLKELDDRKGFKHFNSASHIAIWLHATNNHAVEGGGNWIAMINKFGEKENVNYIINQDKFEYLKTPTNNIIKTISEENRKELFRAIVYIEDKSLNDAKFEILRP